MKRSLSLRLLYSLLIACMVALAPATVVAEADEPAPSFAPGVLITEIQTGLGTGQTDKEYIELFNATDAPIDLSGWQLWYAPESRTSLEAYRVILFDEGVALPAATHLLVASEGFVPNQTTAAQTFEKMLSAEGGNLALLAPAAGECQLAAQDAFAWGNGLLGAGDPVVSSPKTKDKVFTRKVVDGTYHHSRNNLSDFVSSTFSGSTSMAGFLGTPGVLNTQVAPVTYTPPANIGLDFAAPVTDPNCEPPEGPPTQQPPQTIPPTDEPPVTIVPASKEDQGRPIFPARSKGLASPHITELLPNPASPQTDAADEFIELYNSNDAVFELTGFTLVAGKRNYTFPAGTLMEPKSFTAYYSADTKLAMSNSGGQILLLDPFGNVVGKSDPYGTAKDGQAWALASGKWEWTTNPTPKTANVIKAPAIKKKSSATKASTSAQGTKSASAKNGAADVPVAGQITDDPPGSPIHPAMLALVGVFALLYGIYEYRGDLANKLYQFRAYRAARRSLREAPEGRGGDRAG